MRDGQWRDDHDTARQARQDPTGYLADMLLVKGDPLKDAKLLADKENFSAIIKDGKIHRAEQAGSSLNIAA